ncbi:PTS sugar transporter subunit IIA [Thermaerobacter sp. FW80]|uniref:PTS sugar transporter subunit IIA n=1 Tax=Thermaerobacter sp. FW80 TaxID=2546351 RepID=UPI001431DB65|nr:PTS sugar transporter subunit IIA [Thermaerobacter sp. FW80]
MFSRELIMLDLDVADAQGAIRALGSRLRECGHVAETFVDAVLDRERTFPTGLPTRIPVAIPHTDAAHCYKPAIAVGVLRHPVEFGEMGNPQGTVGVRAVFLLSIPDPSQQVDCLRALVEAFQDPHFLPALVGSRTTDEAWQVCQRTFGGTLA